MKRPIERKSLCKQFKNNKKLIDDFIGKLTITNSTETTFGMVSNEIKNNIKMSFRLFYQDEWSCSYRLSLAANSIHLLSFMFVDEKQSILKIHVFTSNPGLIIGTSGKDIDNLTNFIAQNIIGKFNIEHLQIKLVEVYPLGK